MGFRIAPAPDHGTRIDGPPAGWKRPATPLRVVLEVMIRQEGRDPDTKARLEPMTRGVDIDHDPPLKLRAFNPEANDTIPSANNPDHIVIRDRKKHNEKTNGRGHTSYGSDKHAIAKVNRITGKTKGKPKRSWPKRRFQTRKRTSHS